jgi:uncharacterized membrane protein YhaH (DUF805 family)
MGDDLIQRILTPYRRYFDFRGRSSRQEYWSFVLLFIAIATVVIMVQGYTVQNTMADRIVSGIWMVFLAVTIIPGFAAASRRLHDIGKSAWWLLIYFVPLIGGIWLLILLATPSQKGSNKWGVHPDLKKNELDLDILDSQFLNGEEDDELI